MFLSNWLANMTIKLFMKQGSSMIGSMLVLWVLTDLETAT